jgi:hypothetical protein
MGWKGPIPLFLMWSRTTGSDIGDTPGDSLGADSLDVLPKATLPLGLGYVLMPLGHFVNQRQFVDSLLGAGLDQPRPHGNHITLGNDELLTIHNVGGNGAVEGAGHLLHIGPQRRRLLL